MDLFREGRFIEAAEVLATSSDPIENILLKFYSAGAEGKAGLKYFLRLKIDQITDSTNTAYRDVLVLMLFELQLSELEEIQKFGNDQSSSAELRVHLRDFVNSTVIKQSLRENFVSVSDMIRSHDDHETLLYLANTLGEHSVVVDSYIRFGKFDDAINVLAKHGDSEMIEKYLPSLLGEIPEKVAVLLTERRRQLDVSHILNCVNRKPRDEREKKKHVHFVDWIFFKFDECLTPVLNPNSLLRNDKIMYKVAVKLYLDYRPDRLLDFLRQFGTKKHRLPYDFESTLNLCQDKGLTECCVFLYCIDRCYRRAVKTALEISVDLAMKCALEMAEYASDVGVDLEDFLFDDTNETLERPTESEQRNIWRLIAIHIIETSKAHSSSSSMEPLSTAATQNCVSLCMNLIAESKNILKASDIIDNFPPFCTISAFKEMIMMDLRRQCNEMDESRRKITETVDAMKEIHRGLRAQKMKEISVKINDKCDVCARALLTECFEAFVCLHFIHFNCLETIALDRLSEEDRRRYSELRERAIVLTKKWQQLQVKRLPNAAGARQELEDIRKQQRELLPTFCPLCNDIENIDVPIIDAEKHKADNELYNMTTHKICY